MTLEEMVEKYGHLRLRVNQEGLERIRDEITREAIDLAKRCSAENERLIADRELFRKWIVSHHEYLPAHRDYACARCDPGGSLISKTFVCAYHRAVDIGPLQSEGDPR